ncbi:LysM peptidoglycan-binding domain-containing protein [Merdimonas faecis]|uniref:LysM peptidoglycan-binding domain-containing protein n=1 Tax=Merdimonas faecis TaxID=1653435 RepID=UPI0008636ACE|nr:LysM domain-containing protein [Merdimonas faecis]
MERQLPKNVRQIGNVSDEPKIYVEDYVDTYLNQLKDKAKEEPVGIALAGEILVLEGQPVVYISGAFRLAEVEIRGREISLKEETVKQMETDRKKYFPETEIVGWGLIEDGKPMGRSREVGRIHSKYFSKDQSVFIWKDSLDGEEVFYAFKYGELMQMGGHYVFYEKNPAMQNYMISTRKKIGVTPSEVVEDRAAKDFRSVVRERMDAKSDRQNSRLIYITSALLVVVVLVIGVSTMNNYDKMEAVQSSLESLSQSVNSPESQTETVTEDEGDDEEEGAAAKAQVETGETESVQEASGDTASDSSGEGDTDDTGAVMTADPSEIDLDEDDYYVVQKGDTLDTISMKVYGDAAHVDAICRMNGLSDGNLIYIGQKLLLP